VTINMLTRAADPVRRLPDHYREVHYLSINERGMLFWLNILSLIPLAISGLIVFGALMVYHGEFNAPLVIGALPDNLPSVWGIGLMIAVLPLHEWIHGQAIRYYGHKPRYGFKWVVLFATSDGALFRRHEFVKIALAPLAFISAAGAVIMLFLPSGIANWLGLTVVINAAGAIGDLWMTLVALRYDPSVLIRDEEDSIRIFARMGA
jgi:hypothetical protein